MSELMQWTSMIMNDSNRRAYDDEIKRQGQRKNEEVNFEASQLDRMAGEAESIGQRDAANVELSTKLLTSTAIARAAASGAGASDKTVMKVVSETAGMGAYKAAIAMYQGEAQARLDRVRANALRMGGELGMADALAAAGAGNAAASASFLSGAASLSKYWSSPNKTSNSNSNSGWQDTGTQGGGDVGDTALA